MGPGVTELQFGFAIERMQGKPLSKPLVYACSGCSDVGELADRIARELALDGIAEMSCLAGIGGRVKSLVAKAQRAERILVIDGCPLACARKTLELAGFNSSEHLGLHELGFQKGACGVTPECVAAGIAAASALLQDTADAAKVRPAEQGPLKQLCTSVEDEMG